jgi:hypothetical protein
MSPTRSLLVAGGLTALVIAAVLLISARHGAFGLGSAPAADTLPAAAPVLVQDPPASAPAADLVRPARHDDADAHDGPDGRGAHRPSSRPRSDDRGHDQDD